jgi:hypothetical protein
MAEVTMQEREVTVKEKRFTLDLSAEEWEWLKDLIGGQDSTGGNGASSRIWEAMKSPAQAPAAPGPNAYVYKDVVYDLSATYLDHDNDVWDFTGDHDPDGMPLMTCREHRDSYSNWRLSRVIEDFPSLHKV